MLLGCTKSNSASLSEGEIEIANFFILNAKWAIWKRRCVTKYEGTHIPQEVMWNCFERHVESMKQMTKHVKSKKCRKLLDSIKMH